MASNRTALDTAAISASDVSTSASISLHRTLSALLSVIEEENELLARHDVSRHAAFTERKNQALRELMLAQRAHPGIRGLAGCELLLRRIKSGLATNAGLLQLHIAAVGKMSDIIIVAMREADSDGTYSRTDAFGRR